MGALPHLQLSEATTTGASRCAADSGFGRLTYKRHWQRTRVRIEAGISPLEVVQGSDRKCNAAKALAWRWPVHCFSLLREDRCAPSGRGEASADASRISRGFSTSVILWGSNGTKDSAGAPQR
eukprot:5797131-Prymnesium_polylepis.1